MNEQKLYPQGVLQTNNGHCFIVYTDIDYDVNNNDLESPPAGMVIYMDKVDG